jgi:integrase
MTDKAIGPLRQRLIDDMTIRRLGSKTQHDYIRHVKRFADFFGHSVDKATADDVRRYQLRLASIGTTVPTANSIASALRFLFKVTLRRSDLADEVQSVREPRRLPVALSPEEVGRMLAATTNIKHKAAIGLTYATGLRASEVMALKISDIDSDRMVIRVEQGKGKKDRYVMLSSHLLELLRDWRRAARKEPGASMARRGPLARYFLDDAKNAWSACHSSVRATFSPSAIAAKTSSRRDFLSVMNSPRWDGFPKRTGRTPPTVVVNTIAARVRFGGALGDRNGRSGHSRPGRLAAARPRAVMKPSKWSCHFSF